MENNRTLLQRVVRDVARNRNPQESRSQALERSARSCGGVSYKRLLPLAQQEAKEAMEGVRRFAEQVLVYLRADSEGGGMEFCPVDFSFDLPVIRVNEGGSLIFAIVFCEDDKSIPFNIHVAKKYAIPDLGVPLVALCPAHSLVVNKMPLLRNFLVKASFLVLDSCSESETVSASTDKSERMFAQYFPPDFMRKFSRRPFVFLSKKQGRYIKALLVVEILDGDYMVIRQNVLSAGFRELEEGFVQHLAVDSLLFQFFGRQDMYRYTEDDAEDFISGFLEGKPRSLQILSNSDAHKGRLVEPYLQPSCLDHEFISSAYAADAFFCWTPDYMRRIREACQTSDIDFEEMKLFLQYIFIMGGRQWELLKEKMSCDQTDAKELIHQLARQYLAMKSS